MSESARPTAPSHSGSRQNTAGPLGWLAVVVAAGGLLWLIFGKAVSAALARWGQGGKKGGKWVSDRSLGGKMVNSRALQTCALNSSSYTSSRSWACLEQPILAKVCAALVAEHGCMQADKA